MPTVLDLYAGKGWKERKQTLTDMGWEVTTLDYDPSFRCDITVDIMTVQDLGMFDFVWASPPCEKWSVTQIGRNWNRDNTPKTEGAEFAIKFVKHTLDIVKKSARVGWALENPRGKLRKMDFMQGYDLHTVTYCQYGDFRMKPTDIWISGFDWNSRPICKNGDPCHVAAPRCSTTGTQGMGSYADKSVVPLELWVEILGAVSGSMSL